MQAENFWRVTRGSCSVSPGRGASYGLFSGWAFLATILLRLQRCEGRGKSITSKAHSPGFCSVTFHLPFCLNSPVCWHPAHMVRSFTGVGDAWESVMRWVPVTCYLGDFRVCVCVCVCVCLWSQRHCQHLFTFFLLPYGQWSQACCNPWDQTRLRDWTELTFFF